MKELLAALGRQIRRNRDRNLLSPDSAASLDIDPTFLAALEEAAGSRGGEMTSRLVAAAVEALVGQLYSINQYLQVTSEQRRELAAIYEETWREIRATGEVQSTLRALHHPRIRAWVAGLYPASLRKGLSAAPRVGTVICQEYSAELQVRLYGLDPSTMPRPVLDLGCGPTGALVRHLRRAGIEAYGVDRVLSAREPYLVEADWLEPADLPDRWGTIVSNMAFSNHFRYVLQYDPGQRTPYLERFAQLLESLEPGGTFHYGPSVPELEKAVDPRRFMVTVRTVSGALQVSAVRKTPNRRRKK